jgi:hypothetical protein
MCTELRARVSPIMAAFRNPYGIPYYAAEADIDDAAAAGGGTTALQQLQML